MLLKTFLYLHSFFSSLFLVPYSLMFLSCRISAVQFQNWITLSFCFYYSSRILIMPKSVPHSFFPVFYTLWIHFVYFIIVCIEKCILHRERKEMCKIRVPVRKTWKERDRRKGRKNVGGWSERERERGGGGRGGGRFWMCSSAMAI